MSDDLDQLVLTLGGREFGGAWDRVRRYCGLAWSGGRGETWAYRYYDTIESDPDHVAAIDVVAAAALHPGLSRRDLAFFWDERSDLDAWIRAIPVDASLCDANREHLVELRDWPDAPNLGLLTKVLHRKRPAAIPLVDRHVIDWYRPVTAERSVTAAWPGLLQALGVDLVANSEALEQMAERIEAETAFRPSALRIIDITIWMGGLR